MSEPKSIKDQADKAAEAFASVVVNLKAMGIVSCLQADHPDKAQDMLNELSTEDLEYLSNLYAEASRMCARTIAVREQAVASQ